MRWLLGADRTLRGFWTGDSRVLGHAVLLLGAFLAPVATATAQTPIKVMTYNNKHGSTSSIVNSQLDTIAAQNPDVVVLQEGYSTQVTTYVNGLNVRMNTTAWHGSFTKHCKAGTEPNCSTYASEGVMVLSRLKTTAVTPRLIWAKDDYFVARATLRMGVALADGTEVNVFACHLPALIAWRASRMTYVNTITTWAQSFSGPKLLGGDFNEVPTQTPILTMTQQFSDAWALGGSGTGYTHIKDGYTTPYRRIDYWFSDKASATPLSAIKVVGNVADSDHLAVVATYAVPSKTPIAPAAPAETTLMHDSFDTLDLAQWPAAVITGSRDATVPVAIEGGKLRIGNLKEGTTGSHYNGISTGAYNLSSNGAASVQLVTPTNPASTAYAMFAVVRDTSNYYRWYQVGDSLVIQKTIGGVKTTLADLQYDPQQHQFLRIRREANAATGTQDVVFETAPNNGGVPGTFTERHRETWNASVTPASLKFELKAGTSDVVSAPGSAYWDSFHAATNCR
jgi:endonuclease/exonuclease/phosphatase family metal-dependent hydrolase